MIVWIGTPNLELAPNTKIKAYFIWKDIVLIMKGAQY